ncbi:MAG: response regulator [Candidatus Manganitrophus sp. SA1]|nr:response regulator [Candidatus Manganitrophus morganii]
MLSRILVVDDHEDSLNVFSRVLTKAGYDVFLAQNGSEALKSVLQYRPHLIILDLQIPEISGLEVCRTIKENPFSQVIPVLIITAGSDSRLREEIQKAGADELLMKPIDPFRLLSIVNNYLSQSQSSIAS